MTWWHSRNHSCPAAPGFPIQSWAGVTNWLGGVSHVHSSFLCAPQFPPASLKHANIWTGNSSPRCVCLCVCIEGKVYFIGFIEVLFSFGVFLAVCHLELFLCSKVTNSVLLLGLKSRHFCKLYFRPFYSRKIQQIQSVNCIQVILISVTATPKRNYILVTYLVLCRTARSYPALFKG